MTGHNAQGTRKRMVYHAETGAATGTTEPSEGESRSSDQGADSGPPLAATANEARTSLFQQIQSWVKAAMLGRNRETLRQALEDVIEEHEEDTQPLNPEEKIMLHNILALGETEVGDVMVPRSDVIGLPDDVSVQDIQALLAEHGHTRMPVYQDTLDKVVGFLHIKDLVQYIGRDAPFKIEEVMRPMIAVPPSMKIVNLLVRMRSTGMHMALVVDEYGGTDGIITLEDLFEQIVGDIHDEYDENEKVPLFRRVSKNIAVVDAKMDIELLEEHLNIGLRNGEEESYNTLGGLIFTLLGQVPDQGDKIEHNGLIFEIVQADLRRIEKVRIIKSSDYTDSL